MKVRDMVGSNPIVLVGTKMDLLPEAAHPRVRVGTALHYMCLKSIPTGWAWQPWLLWGTRWGRDGGLVVRCFETRLAYVSIQRKRLGNQNSLAVLYSGS